MILRLRTPRVALSDAAVLCAVILAASASAHAADLGSTLPISASGPTASSMPVELRLGGVAHGAFGPEHGGVDLSAEALFDPWRIATQPFYVPRLHVGTSVSFQGKTDTFYSGATWNVPLFGPLYAEAAFGAAANNGYMGIDPVPGKARLGCHVMFRESLGLGAHLGPDWTVTASLDHTSNAHLCVKNTGLTDYGVKLGRVF